MSRIRGNNRLNEETPGADLAYKTIAITARRA